MSTFDLNKWMSDFSAQALAQVGISSNPADGTVAAQEVGKALAKFGKSVTNPPDNRVDPAAVAVQPGSIPVPDRNILGLPVTYVVVGAGALVLIYLIAKRKI